MPKIPPQAKKVFSGVIFDIYQWEQEMFDGTKEIFEMAKRPSTVDIIATTPDGQILVLEQEQPGGHGPFLCTPGGRVEIDEDPTVAARRELLEETGCDSADVELIQSIDPASKLEWTMYLYVARGVKHVRDQELDGGERITVREVSFDEFLKMVANGEFHYTAVIQRLERAAFDPVAREELRKKIFGNHPQASA